MVNRWSIYAVSVFFLAFLIAASTANVGAAAEGASETAVVQQEVSGIALYPDGSTPVQELPVRVWSVDRQRMVYRTKTNKDGIFQIPWLRAGRTFVFVGGVKIDLNVLTPDGGAVCQRHDIVIVVPRVMMVESGPRMTEILIAPMIMTAPTILPVVSP